VAPVAEPPKQKPEKVDKRTAAEERRAREEKKQREREAKEREKAEREAKARADREARDRAKAERDAKARADREARDRAKADRDAKASAERERQEADKVAAANMGEPEGGLTQDQIQKVLSSTRKAFEGCITTSAKSGEVALDGRKVMLRLNIQTNGAVTYPTFDDVTINSTELGSCLKSAARLMVFPKFKGDTMHVEVPLVLQAR
jgi:TolA protein